MTIKFQDLTLNYYVDGLGSVMAVTDLSGELAACYYYEPFGAQQDLCLNTDAITLSLTEPTRYGYTGHEMMNEVGLIQMNGRIYDQAAGRFMQADPLVQDPKHSISFNRYAYVWNNPFNATDPSGYSTDEEDGVGDSDSDVDGDTDTLEANDDAKETDVKPEVEEEDGISFLDTFLDGVQAGFAALGMEPTWGSAADLANAAISGMRGDKLGMAADLGSVLGPVPASLAVHGGKLGGGVAQQVSEVISKEVDALSSRLVHENPKNLIPTQTKAEMTGSRVKKIAKDMKKNGYKVDEQPIDAWRNPDTGRLEIQDGHHRTEAAIKAGLDKVPVNIWE